MLLLKIDPAPGQGKDLSATDVSTVSNLLELIQVRRKRECGERQGTHRGAVEQPHRQANMSASGPSEYRDDDLISVLNLGDEFLVFVTDDGQSPYLFRIAVKAGNINSVLSGGHASSGELSVARFAANGVMSWNPLPRVIRSSIYDAAAQLGATILGAVERTELPEDAKSLRVVLRAGSRMSQQVSGLLSLDLCPPLIDNHQLWQARRYTWSESDQLPSARDTAIAINDNDTVSSQQSQTRL